MKPIRLVMCGCVLIALAVAILRAFEALDRAEKSARAIQAIGGEPFALSAPEEEATPLDLTLRWLKDGAQGDPAPFWDQLIFIAENHASPPLARKRAKGVLLRHSKPQLHMLILRALAEVDGYEEELRRERAIYTRKRKEVERDIQDLKLRYPLADVEKDPNLLGPEEMKELVSYAHAYKRDRMVLDSALARLSEVLQADVQHIQMEQNVFRTQVAQLQKIMDSPGYLPLADVKAWNPALLPIKERLHALITFESVNMRLEELLAHLTQLSGIPMDLDPQVSEMKNIRVTLRITDHDASLAANWTARMVDLDAVETDGRIVLTPPNAKRRHDDDDAQPERPGRSERPSVPNDAPGDF